MIERVRRLGAAALLVAGSALAGPALADEPVKLRISYAVAPAQLTAILFVHPGLARHLGKSYTIEAQRVAGSSIGLQALAANELDLVAMTFNVLGTAIQNAGMDDLRIVIDEIRDGVEGYETNHYMVLKDGPVKTIEDLKGKIVAINGIGGGQDIFMRVMLERHGIKYPGDFTIVEAQFPNMKALLLEKKMRSSEHRLFPILEDLGTPTGASTGACTVGLPWSRLGRGCSEETHGASTVQAPVGVPALPESESPH